MNEIEAKKSPDWPKILNIAALAPCLCGQSEIEIEDEDFGGDEVGPKIVCCNCLKSLSIFKWQNGEIEKQWNKLNNIAE